MVLFLVAYLGLLYTSDSARNISMDTISQSMETDTTITTLEKQDRSDLKRYYQTDEKNVDGYLFYKSPSPMSVDEIFIVKASDREQANQLLENAEAHLAGQKQIFEGYGTDQMALLGEAIVEKKGNYVYYICGKSAGEWRTYFLSLI